MLRGLGFCHECGATLWARRTRHSKRFYRCSNAVGCTGLCHARALPAELVESPVSLHLDKFIGDIDAC